MEVELKQRLVGAFVIIALAVIFIPMIFDTSNINKEQSISIEIPDEPEKLKHKIISIDKISKEDKAENIKTVEVEPIKIVKKETIIDVIDNVSNKTIKVTKEELISNNKKIEIKKDIEVAKPDKPKEQIKPIKSTLSSDNSYRVKFGVFSQQINAQQLKAKIIHFGFSAIVEKDLGNNQYKVYSNYLDSEKAAIKLSAKVQKLKLKIGKPSIEVLDAKSREAAESLLDTGWIVQVGIFSSKENSIKLRNNIRKKGFVCFVDEILNSKKQKQYRARIGPYATRDEAIKEQNNIKNKLGLKGLIKPHEKQKIVL